MRWSLSLLILMGQCLVFVCPLHVYHFINESKTWDEAQSYCRENYTDLGTVYDMNDTQRLNDSVRTDEAWIGLRNNGRQVNTWHWSLPGVEVTREFQDDNEPNDIDGPENCVAIINNEMYYLTCSDEWAFICYDDKKPSGEQYIFHNDKMSWSDAQKYCRENHTDLVSGLDQLKDKNLRNEIKKFNHKYRVYWIGLFRDSWRWSDESKASFRNWESFKDDNSEKCAVTLPQSQKWESRDCDQKRPFFCYKDHRYVEHSTSLQLLHTEDNMILIKEKKTWDNAADYCINHHRGLVSITDRSQQRWAAEKAEEADTEHVWLGLRYTCVLDLWFWVSDELVCYENWASDEQPAQRCDGAVAMSKRGEHEWHIKADNDKFNFICALH